MIIPMLSVVLLFLSFLCKKDKKMFYLLWVFMLIIMAMNTYNNDWAAYEYLYKVIDSIDKCNLTDIGYGFISYLASSYLNISFFEFRALFTFVGMIILACIIIKYASYPALVLALYFIAPFFPNDIIQIRNFMAQVILNFFLAKWIDSDDDNMAFLIIGIGLAATMHVTTFYFVLFFLLYFIKDERKIYICVGIGSLLVGALPVVLSRIPFISSVKINVYLGRTNQGIDVRGVLIIAVFIAQLYILNNIRNYAKGTYNRSLIKWSDTVYKMNILCIPTCAIMMAWSFNFYRVPRNILLLNYISYSMYLKDKTEKTYFNVITGVLIILGLCWSALNSFSQWTIIWNNNALIRW